MTSAEIAAAPWWRWTRGLNSNRGLVVRVEPGRVAPQQIVRVLEDGYISEIRWEPRMGPLLPDLTDPLLPAWLLHLLRERTGPKANVTTYSEEAHWVVWVVRPGPAGRPRWERAGIGPTEIDALLAALQGVGL